MAANQLDERNLDGVAVGGQIHEDLMDKIYDVSPVDLPFTDAIGRMDSTAHEKSWVREALAAADEDNFRIDGSSSALLNNTVVGERLSTFHQISTKTVRVSDRGRNVNTVDTSDELIRQVMKRQRDLRRDCEARITGIKVAVGGNGTSVASETAGIGAWIGTGQASANSDRGGGGTDPVLSGDPGGFPTVIAGLGTSRALSLATVKTMQKEAYLNGGNPTMAMGTPALIERLSTFLFDSSARVATLQSYVDQGNRTGASAGNGHTGGGVAAQASVNVIVGDFGTLELVPNRFQPEVATAVAFLYLIDPDYWEMSYLQGYETKPLARDGLGENREISVDYALCSLAEESSAVVADINTAIAAVA